MSPPLAATPEARANSSYVDPRRGRRIVSIIFAICAAPIVLGTLAFYLWPSDARTTNYGELLPPHPIPIASLEKLRGKWLLVNIDRGACNEACRRDLFAMRQIRTAQGRERERIERVWLVTDATEPASELARLTEGVRVLHVPERDAALFPGASSAARDESIYLIDPLGNLMLRFPPDPDPRKMINDLARLLKLSRIG